MIIRGYWGLLCFEKKFVHHDVAETSLFLTRHVKKYVHKWKILVWFWKWQMENRLL